MRAFGILLLLLAEAGAQPAKLETRAWNAPIAAYGPAFAHTANPRVHLAPGAKLRRVYVRCDFDETPASRPTTCRAVDRATYLVTSADPTSGPFWKWAERTFAISDAPPSPGAAQKLTRSLRVSQDTDLGPETIAIVEYTFEHGLIDEYVLGSCAGTYAPCDAPPVRTGRKIRGFDRMNLVTLGGLEFGFNDALLDMLGSGRLELSLDLVIPSGTAHEQTLRSLAPYRPDSTRVLADLQRADEPDPDIRLALAWDRTVIAAYLRDRAAFTMEYAGLLAELRHRAPPSAMKAVLDRGLPQLAQLDKASLEPPLGLDALL